MSNYKILFKITGSIAAYKSAYLISKLVQNGFEVKVVATDYALKFIGKATLEGLTGNKVLTDSFEDGEMMSHISLNKWADLTIVCPATANTINKLAAGFADNLLTSLFLAHDRTKPYLIAPAMNTLMYDHPATQASLKKMNEWGVQILPASEGYLACGDTGKGKLLEPDVIYEYILLALKKNESHEKRKLKILITSGGTKENIDGVRYLSNLSSGKTGAKIAEYFVSNLHNVTFIHAENSAIPKVSDKFIPYFSFDELNQRLKSLLTNEDFDAVIHLAAVGDYSIESIEVNGKKNKLPLTQKLDSSSERISIGLKRNEKIINHLKEYSKNKNLVLIGFKLTNTQDENERIAAVEKLFKDADCDAVVLNDKNDRDEKDQQKNFSVFIQPEKFDSCQTAEEVAQKIETIILNMKNGK
ncbi:MAG: bifunctional phosphopantothenoylcysteine decarboxylase/phosphopantothenate--cysteine ligase CoaBC [Ignavibacteriaceae bacterium]|nr:bifunctional phosphopantothenoylcysteine decarboxylase/phosphopantothenate--cysteine ligase CoaBC [Ignavibacteriaceae bacterium]